MKNPRALFAKIGDYASKTILIIIPLALAWPVQASPFRLKRYFKNSPDGRYVFIMNPRRRYACSGPFTGIGRLYETRRGGAKNALWKTSGWYARKDRIFLDKSGMYLVRIGWGGYFRLSRKHDGLLFYKRGRLIKRYSTKDLIRDPSKIRFRSFLPKGCVYGYKFIKKARLRARRFHVMTMDGRSYVFDIRTGKILSSRRN